MPQGSVGRDRSLWILLGEPALKPETKVRKLLEFILLLIGLATLGVVCVLWTALSIPLNLLLPYRHGIWIGRWAATLGFRSYLFGLTLMGVARFDLRSLDTLRGVGPLIIMANHPGLLDAPMVISRLPNVACIIKGSLIDSPLWGAGAIMAGYIRNDWFIGSARLAIAELERGGQLLLFPEGTRTDTTPINKFMIGPAYISYRTGAPIQTVFIEQNTGFLGKGWPLLKPPDMPMHFRIRLGCLFQPPSDPREFTKTLHEYFLNEIKSLKP
jgi:1-acyl-sn-glycerol-3-phosphate acyltransferase